MADQIQDRLERAPETDKPAAKVPRVTEQQEREAKAPRCRL